MIFKSYYFPSLLSILFPENIYKIHLLDRLSKRTLHIIKNTRRYSVHLQPLVILTQYTLNPRRFHNVIGIMSTFML